VPLYGGAPMGQQIRALQRGVDVVVATPGRALDHIRRQTLDLSAIETLVLDEADEMLDMGFAEDLDAILTATPKTRQTALFAATMAPRIASIATRHLRTPTRITIKAEKRAPGKMPRIRQVAYQVSRQQKTFALGRILEFEDPASAIVFCRTRLEVDELTETLKSHGYGAQALHGGLDQRQRDRVMQAFRTSVTDVLVATDVAARGLDIDHVSHVVNYDIPTAPEVYVHRIGRTGRIGREGVAITLVSPRERRLLRDIENLTKQTIEKIDPQSLAAAITSGFFSAPENIGVTPRRFRRSATAPDVAEPVITARAQLRSSRRALRATRWLIRATIGASNNDSIRRPPTPPPGASSAPRRTRRTVFG
jgi:ATP-dependent RNA helicase DeaD